MYTQTRWQNIEMIILQYGINYYICRTYRDIIQYGKDDYKNVWYTNNIDVNYLTYIQLIKVISHSALIKKPATTHAVLLVLTVFPHTALLTCYTNMENNHN